MYSLLSASVLAIDLARHPSGAAVADAVDRVLALTPHELSRMTVPAPEPVRHRVLEACAAEPRTNTLRAAPPDESADVLTTRTRLLAWEDTLLGGLTDLLDLLQRELPLRHAAPEARQVALDGVTVAWAGRVAPLVDLNRLQRPWAQALDPVPSALPVTAYSPALGLLLDGVSRRSPSQWHQVAAAHGAHRGTLTWSKAMHQACRAAFDADRLHDVARAQLGAARALRHSGASTGVDARAIAMAVTAGVQATCTRDLVGEPVATALLSAWEAGS